MAKFFAQLNSEIQKMKWFDVALLKIAVLFFALFLADLFPQLLGWDWQTYFVLSFIAVLPIIFRIFEKLWFRLIYIAFYGAIYLLAEYYF